METGESCDHEGEESESHLEAGVSLRVGEDDREEEGVGGGEEGVGGGEEGVGRGEEGVGGGEEGVGRSEEGVGGGEAAVGGDEEGVGGDALGSNGCCKSHGEHSGSEVEREEREPLKFVHSKSLRQCPLPMSPKLDVCLLVR